MPSAGDETFGGAPKQTLEGGGRADDTLKHISFHLLPPPYCASTRTSRPPTKSETKAISPQHTYMTQTMMSRHISPSFFIYSFLFWGLRGAVYHAA